MKTILIIILNLLFSFIVKSQSLNSAQLLESISKAQAKIITAAYTVDRTDTFVTGDIRTLEGKALTLKDETDTLLGFRFLGKKANENSERVYDGHIGYETDTALKTYRLLNTPHELKYILLNGGGQVVVPEIMKIDTIGATSIQVAEDANRYYLKINFPDILAYDVEQRRKIVGIDKKTMLPVSVRSHQETYGKVQDLYWEITSIQVNQPLLYNFVALPFLQDYTHVEPVGGIQAPSLQLRNTNAPDFELETFEGKTLSSASLKGQVILLDFWEVWCGPCIASMPKVQALYEKYKKQGLVVYGIVNESKNLMATREFVKKRSIKLPLLIGNEMFQKDYKFDGSVPLYIIINKKGKISLVQFGFNENIESLIQQELN